MSGAPLPAPQKINLGALIGLGIAALLWAAFTLVDLDVLDDPYYVTVELEDSGLISAHTEVAHLGVRVGKVSSVGLSDDMGLVEARLRLDEGTEIPDDVHALVSRKSAIGEPFIDLLPPPPGEDGEVPARSETMLAAGDVIGSERTELPVRFEDVLEGVNSFVAPLDPEAAAVLIHELAVGIDGRVTDLRALNEGFAQILDGIADRRDRLARLSDNSAIVLDTFAEHRESLGASLEHMNALTATLAEARDTMDRALVEGEEFVGMAESLVDSELPVLDCLLSGLAGTADGYGTDETLAALDHMLVTVYDVFETIEPAHDFLDDGARWARGGLVFTDSEGIYVYEEPRGIPDPRAVPACESTLGEVAGDEDRGAVDEGGDGPAGGDGGDGSEDPSDVDLASGIPDQPSASDDLLPTLLKVLGAILLASALFLGARRLWALRS